MTVDMWARTPHQPTPAVGVRIEADPLGPVNQIVRLVRYNDDGSITSIRAALCRRVEAGTKVTLTQDAGSMWRTGPGWRALNGFADPEPEPFRLPGYRVEIDGREVLYAPDAEIWPAPKVQPSRGLKVSWNAIPGTIRAAADRLARRLGYRRESECTGWDE